MRKPLAIFLIILVHGLTLAQTERARKSPSLMFNHVTVNDMTGGPSKPDMTVVVVGNRIAAIGKTGKIREPRNAFVIDAKGKYLIPGLWDMHVHVFHYRLPLPPDEYKFPLFIANGVTGVREMWTKPDKMDYVKLWRKQFYEQPGTVPRFVAVGTLVDGPPVTWKNSDSVSTADEARLMVDKLKAGGVDFVKVYNNLSREAYFAIADEAKKQHIPFAGHVPFRILLREATNAGQQSVEHLTGILKQDCPTLDQIAKKEFPNGVPKDLADRPFIEQAMELCDEKRAFAFFQELAKNDTWEVPTFPVRTREVATANSLEEDTRLKYIPAEERDSWKKFSSRNNSRTPDQTSAVQREMQRALELVKWMHRAGVEFMAGTDVGNEYIYPGFSLHDDLAMFVKAGFTPLEALQTATRNPAKFLGMLDSLGTIEEGKFADLVLLEANPLEDIRNTRRINAVVVNGSYLPKETLQKMLTEAELNASKR